MPDGAHGIGGTVVLVVVRAVSVDDEVLHQEIGLRQIRLDKVLKYTKYP